MNTPNESTMGITSLITPYDATGPIDSPVWVLLYGLHWAKGAAESDMTFISITIAFKGYRKVLETKPLVTICGIRSWRSRREICHRAPKHEGKLLLLLRRLAG
jgi:hypothetical protein